MLNETSVTYYGVKKALSFDGKYIAKIRRYLLVMAFLSFFSQLQ